MLALTQAAETELEYDLEVEVMSNVSEQKDTSDDDEPKKSTLTSL